MLDVLGAMVALFTAAMAIGALTGRVKVRSCCAISDPRQDLRMRDAFIEENSEATTLLEEPGNVTVHTGPP
jgi:hypothetical protein